MLSLGGGVSGEDSATLLALAKALEMLVSWSSYRKTPVVTTAQLEPSLANSSAISFFPHKICRYSRPLKLFSNLQSFWQYGNILSSKHDHSLLAWLTTSKESPRTLSRWMPSVIGIVRPWRNTSYSVALLDVGKCIWKIYLKLSPLGGALPEFLLLHLEVVRTHQSWWSNIPALFLWEVSESLCTQPRSRLMLEPWFLSLAYRRCHT
jgi:hypothetical protein